MNGASTQNRRNAAAGIPADWHDARAFAYDLLKWIFRAEPSDKLIDLLAAGGMLHAFPCKNGDADLGAAVDTMLDYLKQPDVAAEEKLQRLRLDYTRLFIGPAEVPAPPWESLYRDVERLHFSRETLAVRDAYRRHGLMPARLGRDPDDHIGLELDFMHRLCERAREKAQAAPAEALDVLQDLQDQKAFLEDHLLQWVPAWSKDVEQSADTDFYRGAARLLAAFLKIDLKLLDEAVALSPS